ncbi:paraquat-inducible protein A [Pararhodospirillum photometricum]|uniref:Uncharacterized paraquat-inducible protein A n=1 Tax=Pararhodospirillum photometricum DSM 122 TaxID=1150469 RepID=H6SP91_PARPM|nr:PqiA/YebS family transporter subunit [Pararhodospirillum photometricum]CCG09416.1 Uncharacterized paraquat-inducible protein A [Pararhodospirillum photometricum DSM 122]
MTPAALDRLGACPACDTVYLRTEIAPGASAHCLRCGSRLYTRSRFSPSQMLALVLGALILGGIANTTPIVEIQFRGLASSTTLIGAIVLLVEEGEPLVGMLAALTTVVFPVLDLGLLAAVLLGWSRGERPVWFAPALRLILALRPWGMVEVFMLGVLVALVKLSAQTQILPGPALWAFAALTVLLVPILTFDPRFLWNRAGEAGASSSGEAAPSPQAPPALVSARAAGLVACETCGQLHPRAHVGPCTRCHAPIHPRKPASLQRVGALLLGAVILYVPANLLPVMQTTTLKGEKRDTILSGVVYFWETGSPELAILIFSVSVLIPLVKMAALAFLITSTHRRWAGRRHTRLRLFALVDAIGRWSMLDVFVVTLMVGLVRFQALARIEAGPGAAAFGAVVILTMLAVHSFDPRLMWDPDETDHGP